MNLRWHARGSHVGPVEQRRRSAVPPLHAPVDVDFDDTDRRSLDEDAPTSLARFDGSVELGRVHCRRRRLGEQYENALVVAVEGIAAAHCDHAARTSRPRHVRGEPSVCLPWQRWITAGGRDNEHVARHHGSAACRTLHAFVGHPERCHRSARHFDDRHVRVEQPTRPVRDARDDVRLASKSCDVKRCFDEQVELPRPPL